MDDIAKELKVDNEPLSPPAATALDVLKKCRRSMGHLGLESRIVIVSKVQDPTLLGSCSVSGLT